MYILRLHHEKCMTNTHHKYYGGGGDILDWVVLFPPEVFQSHLHFHCHPPSLWLTMDSPIDLHNLITSINQPDVAAVDYG